MLEQDTPPLDTDPVALALELRTFFGAFRRRLWEQSDNAELSQSQIAAMLRLDELRECTTSDLARAEGMRPQSMGAIIAALENAGLVQGAPDPADGRKTLLSLSTQGRKFLEDGRAARQDWVLRRIADRLSQDERAQLLATMPLLQKLVAP